MKAKLIKITWPTYVETNIFLPVPETTNMEGCRQLLSLFHLDTSHPIASNSLHHPAFLTRAQCTEILHRHRRYIFEEFKPGPNIPSFMASLASRKTTLKWKSTRTIKIHSKWVRSPSGSFKLLGLLAVKWIHVGYHSSSPDRQKLETSLQAPKKGGFKSQLWQRWSSLHDSLTLSLQGQGLHPNPINIWNQNVWHQNSFPISRASKKPREVAFPSGDVTSPTFLPNASPENDGFLTRNFHFFSGNFFRTFGNFRSGQSMDWVVPSQCPRDSIRPKALPPAYSLEPKDTVLKFGFQDMALGWFQSDKNTPEV